MSAMDRGLLAGLAGGGELVFSRAYHRRTALLPRPLYAGRQSLFGPTVAGANKMKRALVIGSGAGGATAAKELQGAFDVTVLEAGGEFRPLSLSLRTLERLKSTHLLFDERLIHFPFPAMQIRKTPDMVLVNGIGTGGSTAICCGNAVRMDQDLRALGIDLDAEFEEIFREIPISTAHQKVWRKHTRQLFQIFQEMGLQPMPMPKMGDFTRCKSCGRCMFGCPEGVKWDSRQYLDAAVAEGRGADYRLQRRVSGDRGRPGYGCLGSAGTGASLLPGRPGGSGGRRLRHPGDP